MARPYSKTLSPKPAISAAALALKKMEEASRVASMFAGQWRMLGLPNPTPEYVFHARRKWRFDFALPDLKVAIEIDGGTLSRKTSRHTSGIGYRNDAIKLNEAARLGWRVFRFTSDMVTDWSAARYMRDVLAFMGVEVPAEDRPMVGRKLTGRKPTG